MPQRKTVRHEHAEGFERQHCKSKARTLNPILKLTVAQRQKPWNPAGRDKKCISAKVHPSPCNHRNMSKDPS